MTTYRYDHTSSRATTRSWGLGTVLSDAEGSTGQGTSSEEWTQLNATFHEYLTHDHGFDE